MSNNYKTLRAVIAQIDESIAVIEAARSLPRHHEYQQERFKVTYDSTYSRDVSAASLAIAKAALAETVVEARRTGERLRDAIIVTETNNLHSLRAALNQCCGSAVIDLGVMAREIAASPAGAA